MLAAEEHVTDDPKSKANSSNSILSLGEDGQVVPTDSSMFFDQTTGDVLSLHHGLIKSGSRLFAKAQTATN
jgi:hypothetical protein